MTRFVPAILTVCFAAVCLPVQASRAADDCLAKPNAPSPQGSHWYYRVDRTTHRQCWYLGAESTKVRPQVRQAASPVRPPAPNPILQPPAQAAVEATIAEVVPGEIEAGEAETALDAATAPLSMRWSGLPKSAASIDRTPVSMSNSYAEEQPAVDPQDDMPLIWPILTPSDLAAAERAPQFTTKLVQLGAALAAMLMLAIFIVRIIMRFSTARNPDRPHARNRWGSAATAARPREQDRMTFADAAAPAYREMVRRTVKATPRDPAADIEGSVRRLLHELQRRQAHRCRDFEPTSRQAVA
jgi:hypothetical protein